VKNNTSKAVLIIAATILSGCATTANYEKTLGSWVGSSADSLVLSWGPPSSEYNLSSGGKVIEYVKRNNITIPGYTYNTPVNTYHNGTTSTYGKNGTVTGSYSGTSTTYVQQQTSGQNINLICTTRFTISPNDIIQNWAWEGNNCKQRAN
jgi:hypothetical protein